MPLLTDNKKFTYENWTLNFKEYFISYKIDKIIIYYKPVEILLPELDILLYYDTLFLFLKICTITIWNYYASNQCLLCQLLIEKFNKTSTALFIIRIFLFPSIKIFNQRSILTALFEINVVSVDFSEETIPFLSRERIPSPFKPHQPPILMTVFRFWKVQSKFLLILGSDVNIH